MTHIAIKEGGKRKRFVPPPPQHNPDKMSVGGDDGAYRIGFQM
jgi:hypothetical protein